MKKIYLALLMQGNMRFETMIWLNKQLQRSDITLYVSKHYREPVQSNRNAIALDFLKSDADYLVMIDNDTVPPENLFELLDLNKDIITPLVCMWSKTILQIMAFNKNPDAKVGGYLAIPMDSKGLMEVDYIGTAVMMVKREVMESIKRPFDCQYNDDGVVEVGEDFSFCERAKEKGYRVWVHLDYVSNHYKEINLENIYNFLITNTTKKPKKVARAKK